MLPVCMMKECAFTVLMKVYHAKHLKWTHMLVAHTKFAHTTGTQFPMQTGCSGLCGLSIPLPGSVDELIACWQLHMQGCNRLMVSCVSMFFFFQKKETKAAPQNTTSQPWQKVWRSLKWAWLIMAGSLEHLWSSLRKFWDSWSGMVIGCDWCNSAQS